MSDRFCRDCKHADKSDPNSAYWVCAKSVHVNLVSGVVGHYYCGSFRLGDGPDACGKDGKMFESNAADQFSGEAG